MKISRNHFIDKRMDALFLLRFEDLGERCSMNAAIGIDFLKLMCITRASRTLRPTVRERPVQSSRAKVGLHITDTIHQVVNNLAIAV